MFVYHAIPNGQTDPRETNKSSPKCKGGIPVPFLNSFGKPFWKGNNLVPESIHDVNHDAKKHGNAEEYNRRMKRAKARHGVHDKYAVTCHVWQVYNSPANSMIPVDREGEAYPGNPTDFPKMKLISGRSTPAHWPGCNCTASWFTAETS